MKALLRRPGPAWSIASFNAGDLLALMGSVRAGFKSICVTEIDKDFKKMTFDFTGHHPWETPSQ